MKKDLKFYIAIIIIGGLVAYILVMNPAGKQEIKALKNHNKELKLRNDSLIQYANFLLNQNKQIKIQVAEKDSLIKESEEIENSLIKAIINLDKTYKYEKDNPLHTSVNDKFNYIRSELLH